MRNLKIPFVYASRISVHVLLAAAAGHAAQPAPIGLLRLRDNAKPGAPTQLAAGRFAVDALAPGAVPGAAKAKRNDVDVLVLPAGQEWSQPLRGSPKDVTFASFGVYASRTTVIEMGGARLGLTDSSSKGYLQLMYDDSAGGALQWRGLGVIMRAEPHDGRMLAPLPVLTIRIDPEQNGWDVYSDARLLAHNLPLIAAKKSDRKITVKAGVDGVWICGLVLADENPLYEDSNENGIDDRFELRQRGGLLATNASLPERTFFAERWKIDQREKGAPILHFKRPLPDRALVAGPPR